MAHAYACGACVRTVRSAVTSRHTTLSFYCSTSRMFFHMCCHTLLKHAKFDAVHTYIHVHPWRTGPSTASSRALSPPRSLAVPRTLAPPYPSHARSPPLSEDLFGSLRRVRLDKQALVDRVALVPLFARGDQDLDHLRREPPVHQAWVEGRSRERLGSHGVGWRGEEYRVCRPTGAGIAYRCDSPRCSGEVVDEVVDRSRQSCQAR